MNAHALRLHDRPSLDDDAQDKPRAPGRRPLTGKLSIERHRQQMIDQAVGAGTVGLPETLSHRLTLAYGRPLGAFYLHTSPEANQAARAMGARAFTVGRNIFFAAGRFDPDSKEGQRLIAHEVAHAIQQQDAPRGAGELSKPGDPHEAAAQHFALAFIGARPMSAPHELGTASQQVIAREEDDAPASEPSEPAEAAAPERTDEVTSPTSVDSEGYKTQRFDDGSTLQTSPEGETQATQATDNDPTVQRFDDDSTLSTRPDGTSSATPAQDTPPTTRTFDDGSTLTNNPDGTSSATDAWADPQAPEHFRESEHIEDRRDGTGLGMPEQERNAAEDKADKEWEGNREAELDRRWSKDQDELTRWGSGEGVREFQRETARGAARQTQLTATETAELVHPPGGEPRESLEDTFRGDDWYERYRQGQLERRNEILSRRGQ